MNLFRSVGTAAWSWIHTARAIPRFSVWAPLLMFSMLQAASALLLFFFDQPDVVSFMAPVVRALGGEAATHYPDHVYAMPSMFETMNFGIVALVGSIALGAATVGFARFFGAARKDGSWKLAVRATPRLVVLMLLILSIDRGMAALFGLIPEEIRFLSNILRLGLAGLQLLLIVIILAFLVYSVAWMVLRDHSLGSAVSASVRFSRADFLTTFILVAVPAGLLFPFSFVLGEMDLSQTRLLPEVVAIILGAQILAEFVLGFFLVGSVTRIFVGKVEILP